MVFVLHAALFACGSHAATSLTAIREHNREVYARTAQAIVAVECNGRSASGIVVSNAGTILATTSIVPAGTNLITIVLADGRRYAATIVTSDDATGICLLQCDTKGLSALEFGDSTSACVGDAAYTVANSFDAVRDGQVAFSAGHISGRYALDGCGAVFETDAAVNPGSEGGALLNGDGRLIGVIGTRLDARRRLGTAIPIDRVRKAFSHFLWENSVAKSETKDGGKSPAGAAVVKVIRPVNECAGVVIDPSGLVLTCASGGRDAPILVELGDGRTFAATMLALDETLDAALLKIVVPDGERLAFQQLHCCDCNEGCSITTSGLSGNSACGCTCNSGIVSAGQRFFGTARQIDAKVNADNYGGPVRDSGGNLVGIVTHFAPTKDYSQPNCGIGFFTPAAKLVSYFGVTLLKFPASIACDHPSSSVADDGMRWITQARRCTATISDGAGVVISPDGYMMTCAHVTEGRSEWPVRLNGKDYVASVIELDKSTDLSLLKIQGAHNLDFAMLADAAEVRVGDPVLAAGDPFKLSEQGGGPAFSVGIVSALHRNQGRCCDVIQTDAAINPGSSGGPLFTCDGKLLGINGQIRCRSTAVANTGVAFATLPSKLSRVLSIAPPNKPMYVSYSK